MHNSSIDSSNQPLVSIIVPSYNHEKFITQCIESIYAQTYRNIELIVIDDGSSDASRDILQEFKNKFNFELIFQENRGISYTLNRGIKEFAKGKYVCFCASDDYWTPEKLQIQVTFMENNRFYPMCYGRSYIVDEDSRIIENTQAYEKGLRGGWIFEDIFTFKIHPPVNYLFHKIIFDEVGYFEENVIAEDFHLNLLISAKYPIGFIDQYISYYRKTNVSFKIERFDKVSDSHLKSIELFKDHRFYLKAKAMVNLRRFDMFSGFVIHKIKALKNIKGSLPLFYNLRFIIAFIKLICFWKVKSL